MNTFAVYISLILIVKAYRSRDVQLLVKPKCSQQRHKGMFQSIFGNYQFPSFKKHKNLMDKATYS